MKASDEPEVFHDEINQGHRKPPLLRAARLPAPHLDGTGQDPGKRLRSPAKTIPAGAAAVYL